MSTITCYLERSPTGDAIRRVRVLGPALDRSWSAPTDDDTSLHEQTSRAASWVREQLAGARTIDSVCVDAGGTRCQWLSAPSTDPRVVGAALQQLGTGLDDSEMMALGGTSLQALVDRQSPAPSVANGLATAEDRMAVLTMPDASARLFLDELDDQKVEVTSVLGLWHAMARVWDPDVRYANRGEDSNALVDERPGQGRTSAIVMIDPNGRLHWVWTRAGELVAGGSMLLRTAPAPTKPDPIEEAFGRDENTPTRVARASEERVVICTPDEMGRLSMEWLAWSAQLGENPDRIVAIGAPVVGEDPSESVALAELLGRAWPGTLIDVAHDGDPIGRTLDRLNASAPDREARPRAAMMELSNRPGRVDRAMYRWVAVAVLVLAGCVVAGGWKMRQAVGSMRAQAAATTEAQEESLNTFAAAYDDIDAGQLARAPTTVLRTKLLNLNQLMQQAQTRRTKPIMPELFRVLEAIEPHADEASLKEISFNRLKPDFKLGFTNPGVSAAVQELLASSGGRLRWDKLSGSSTNRRNDSERIDSYLGTWIELAPSAPGGS